jgi:hypothetical protein
MNYKPDQQELIAYLYDELEGDEKLRVEKYLLQHPDERRELAKLGGVSKLLKHLEDKEVIAPPLFIPEGSRGHFWNAPYFRTIISIAASLIIVILVARFSGARLTLADREFRLSFGDTQTVAQPEQTLTAGEVQQMINQSLQANNSVLTDNWDASRRELEKSIQGNLVINSGKMNELVKQASTASQSQVQDYITSLRAENLKMVKDYFALSSSDQKQYIETLLVDFAKYLQQQRNDDLQLVQMRLNTIEQKSSVFQHETEQILTSIISGVGAPVRQETKY